MMNATYCLPSFILKKSAKNAIRVSHDATQRPRNLSYLALTTKTIIQIATPVFLKIAISSTGDMLAERPATSKDCARTAPSAKLVALGFDEPCELAALVTGIRDDRFDRRKDWEGFVFVWHMFVPIWIGLPREVRYAI